MNLLRCGLSACTLLLLGACANSDIIESSYGSMGEARDSDAVGKGWVPEWLPRSAGKIREIHNLDTGEWAVSFSYPEGRSLHIPTDCVQEKPLEIEGPRIDAYWWPNDVPPGLFTTHRHSFFRCSGYAVAKSDKTGQGFVWSIALGG